jgi:hypothetical protein
MKHVPTDYELHQEARRLRAGGENYSWYWNKAYPEFDFLLTGTLKLSMSLWDSHGSRLDWQDRKTFSLEDQIDDIVIAFEERLEADRLRKIERERERRLSIRADENRRLAEQRRKREDERDALITEIVLLQTKARDLNAWIDWATPIDDPETRRMLEWARKRLASIERAVNPGKFGDWLREKKLFPEVDPFAPLPSDPDLETGGVGVAGDRHVLDHSLAQRSAARAAWSIGAIRQTNYVALSRRNTTTSWRTGACHCRILESAVTVLAWPSP